MTTATITSNGSRKRTVFSTEMVAHVFAQQRQESGRNAGNTFYFRGDTVYSYRDSFPIARLITHKGRKAVLFTTRDYSVTTSGHKRCVRNALGNANGPIFFVQDVRQGSWANETIDHKANVARYREDLLTLAKRVAKARTNREWLMRELQAQVGKANAYLEFFGLRIKPFVVPTMDDVRKATDSEKRKEALAAKKHEEDRKRRIAEYEAIKQRWMDGEDVSIRGILNRDDNVCLRIKGDTLETSLGAVVPLSHAVKILPLIRSGSPYLRNGHSIRLGHFVLDSIDGDTGDVRAGCHTVRREEIERIATILGL